MEPANDDRRWRWFLLAVVGVPVAGLLALFAFALWRVPVIVVRNDSGRVLHDVRLRVDCENRDGHDVTDDAFEPGERLVVRGSPGDSGLELEGLTVGGRELAVDDSVTAIPAGDPVLAVVGASGRVRRVGPR